MGERGIEEVVEWDWDCEIWVEIRARGIQAVIAHEIPRKMMRIEVETKVGVKRVQMVRSVVRRWESVHVRRRVRDLICRRERRVGF